MPTCDEFCDIGYCTGLPTTEGDAQNVCWIKRPSGTCVQPTDCQSNNCVADACAPPGGQPNGAGCDVPDDCQSKSCVASTCRGLALLGDTCESSADCAVGMCCTTGDLANTCNNACN
jgi:hypothetical protein